MSAYPIAAATDAIMVAFAARGLTITREAARQWVTAEQGVNNNILGVTYATPTGRALYRYPDLAGGAAAAARLIATNRAYEPLRAALRPGVSTGDQLAAIIASPWNRPNSPYYRRAFSGETASSPKGSTTMSTLPDAIRTNVRYIRRLVGNQNPPILGLIDPYLDKIDDYALRLDENAAPAVAVSSFIVPAAPEAPVPPALPDPLETVGEITRIPGTTDAAWISAQAANMSLADWYLYQLSQGGAVGEDAYYGATADPDKAAEQRAAYADAVRRFGAGERYAVTPE